MLTLARYYRKNRGVQERAEVESGVKKKMYFEASIRLERADRDVLLADLDAVERLLSERKMARVIEHAETIIAGA